MMREKHSVCQFIDALLYSSPQTLGIANRHDERKTEWSSKSSTAYTGKPWVIAAKQILIFKTKRRSLMTEGAPKILILAN